MRLYAFLLFALCTLAARAATIPVDDAPPSEKKIADATADKDKAPENVSSEQELIDQANTINDVDNKLRVKPDDIPVEVIVDNVEAALKLSDESEEIIRPPVDLRNPGPPQRQEHETQNPEFYAAEQQMVQAYKQNVNDAQVVLRQGFQEVSDGIQNMFENNEQTALIQQSIQSLREGFIARINKLNDTIQNYLNAGNANEASTAEQTKANFQLVETGLSALKNDFTRGVNTLADGVIVFATLRAENEKPAANAPSTGSAPAPVNPAPAGSSNILLDYINRFQTTVQSGFNNITQSLNDYMTQVQTQGIGSLFNSGQQASTAAPAPAPPAGAQYDTQVPATSTQSSNPWLIWPNPTQQPGAFGSGTGPLVQGFQYLQNSISNFLQQNRPETQKPPVAPAPTQTAEPAKPAEAEKPSTTEQKPSEPAQPASKPDSKPEETVKPEEPAAQPNEYKPVATGPIRQILQNNPISQGIAGAVQKVQQNINNPEKPRETEKEKAVEELAVVDDKSKGHSPGSGDNNDSTRIEESEPAKEVQNETLPEVKEPKKEEAKEQKTEEVVDKTE